jgi:hypothetical protein
MRITEDPSSRRRELTVETRIYNVDAHEIYGQDNEEEQVRLAVWAYCPTFIGNWPRRRYHQSTTGGGIWQAEVQYEIITWQYAFEINGGTEHITQSKATPLKVMQGGAAAPDLKGAIGYDGMTVHGCDIYVPKATWTEGYEVPALEVTPAYQRQVRGIVGKTNAVGFRGEDPYSVMLLGVTGSLSSSNPDFFQLQFRFACEKRRTSFYVGSILVSEKKGWDYLWVRYTEDTDGNQIIRKPNAVYVEQVYDAVDYAQLWIGTGDTGSWHPIA